MDLNLSKGSPLFIATLMALALDPMPYILVDKGDSVQLIFKAGIPAERIYRVGAMANDLVKAVTGVKRTYKEKWFFMKKETE